MKSVNDNGEDNAHLRHLAKKRQQYQARKDKVKILNTETSKLNDITVDNAQQIRLAKCRQQYKIRKNIENDSEDARQLHLSKRKQQYQARKQRETTLMHDIKLQSTFDKQQEQHHVGHATPLFSAHQRHLVRQSASQNVTQKSINNGGDKVQLHCLAKIGQQYQDSNEIVKAFNLKTVKVNLIRVDSAQHIPLGKRRLQNKTSNEIENANKDARQLHLDKRQQQYQARKARETAMQRESRLQAMRDHRREQQLNIGHATRLFNAQQRRLVKQSEIRNFNLAVNTFLENTCDVCHKCLYPKQVNNFVVDHGKIPHYLPPELATKYILMTCARCKTHLMSLKQQPPSTAYWNNLYSGDIPEEIALLSQIERRLIARINPFVKIIKFSGKFGQFGFKGQAVLFAQDIFEVTKQLPKMLPVSPAESGIVIVLEELENLNITREFSVSRDRINNALNWLILNNPLYADVINVTDSTCIKINDFVRHHPVIPEVSYNLRDPSISSYLQINNFSRIIHASWHQGDLKVFNNLYAGAQCACMALSAIIKGHLVKPSKWNTNIYNEVLLQGDSLYATVRLLSENAHVHILANGHLRVSNFDVIRHHINMYNSSLSLNFDEYPAIFGTLNDSLQHTLDFGFILFEGVKRLFDNHNCGILIGELCQKSLAIMQFDNKYYLADSHSCGKKGATAANGRACVIQCDTLTELVRICRRITGSTGEYSVDFVDITVNIDNYICSIQPTLTDTSGNQYDSNISHYVQLSTSSSILHASWHQGDTSVFNSLYAGAQCACMALSAIIKSHIMTPSHWNMKIYNQVLLQGDSLYESVRRLSEKVNLHIPVNGHLRIINFDVIRQHFLLYNKSFSLNYESNPAIFGTLNDSLQHTLGFGLTLRAGLKQLFDHHTCGIMIGEFCHKSLAVMNFDNKYYLADSHSCDNRGVSSAHGCACVIQCDKLEELLCFCKSTMGSTGEYSLDFVDVTVINDIVSMNEIENNIVIESFKNNVAIERSFEGIEQHRKGIVVNTIAIEAIENNIDIEGAFEGKEQHMQGIIVNSLPVMTSAMCAIDCNQPMEETVLDKVPKNQVQLNTIKRKTDKNIVNVGHERKAEEFAWFHLFPFGRNGYNQDRPVHITPLDYYKLRILGKDTRFQSNEYLFYALSMYEYEQIRTNINVSGHKILQNNSMVEDIHLNLRGLRGSAAYWRMALNELIAQIRCLGPPHYFITLSCNDLNWLDMRQALLFADGQPHKDPTTLTIYEVQILIEKYPVVLSRQFMIRLNALMTYLKANHVVLGGKLNDYWWRIEFQNRGSPHIHMVVWIEGTPDFNTVEGIKRIDQVMRCDLPEEDDELKCLVQKLLIHRHTQTCQNHNSTYCRFGFPRIVSTTTKIVTHTSNEFVANGGRICILKRKDDAKYINNYSPSLLKLWQANLDIQPCGSNESIALYIAKYISKGEPTGLDKGLAEAIRKIRQEETNISRKLFRICMKILNERQISACECAYRLCHLRLRESSRRCIFLNTRKPEQRYKVINFDKDNKAIGFCNNIIDRYQKRPLEQSYNTMCLIDFAMQFEPYYSCKSHQVNEDDGDEDAYEHYPVATTINKLIILQDDSKMKVRNIRAVVRVPFFKDSIDPENYFYSLLAQYYPFRNETELLNGFVNAKEAFLSREENIKQMSHMMEQYCTRDQQLYIALEKANAFAVIENFLTPEHEPENIPEKCNMNDSDFNRGKCAMNVGQRDLFNLVTQSISSQLNGSECRVKLFITGSAGSGKTFTLNLLKEQVKRCFGSDKTSLKVCALTGVAARLINGATLHSVLKLPVQKDGKILYMPHLSGEILRRMRLQWQDVQFIIIDEISMVPYEMLCMIDQRLKQLKNSESLFGGLNVLLFGDLLQLPPVRGSAVFHQPDHMQPATHLWREFSFCELNQNMRQQGDNTFIDLLNNLRVGTLQSHHLTLLLDKLNGNDIDDFSIEKALRIHPTIKQVDNHNKAVIDHFSNKNVVMVAITAQDKIIHSTRNLENAHLAKLIPTDINKTGALPKNLILFTGAKVMLRYNVNTAIGLVNGAMGEVVEIVWPHFRKAQLYAEDIPSVIIDFYGIGVHQIDPMEVQFPAKYSYGTAERRMLPLILCWSSTVHKMQGTTVDRAVINLGSKIFAPGQAYVALSRVRSLEGLRLEEIDCGKITSVNTCNQLALKEMQRLRLLLH